MGRRRKPNYSRPWLIRYYASGLLSINNWSTQGYAKELLNAKRSAVVHIIIEQWTKAVIVNRYTGNVACVLNRTQVGITVKEM